MNDIEEYIIDETPSDGLSLSELRAKRKESFINFLQDEKHEKLRLWQALLAWAKVEYKDEIVPLGDKPEIHKIFVGFDQDACEDVWGWD